MDLISRRKQRECQTQHSTAQHHARRTVDGHGEDLGVEGERRTRDRWPLDLICRCQKLGWTLHSLFVEGRLGAGGTADAAAGARANRRRSAGEGGGRRGDDNNKRGQKTCSNSTASRNRSRRPSGGHFTWSTDDGVWRAQAWRTNFSLRGGEILIKSHGKVMRRRTEAAKAALLAHSPDRLAARLARINASRPSATPAMASAVSTADRVCLAKQILEAKPQLF